MAGDEYTMTWTDVLADDGVQTIEDPLHKTSTDKATFAGIYGPVLESFDGSDMSAYFDFYFEESVVMPGHWVFKDEDAKEDFCDAAQDEGCMPSFKEVHEGESAEAKAKRKAEEAAEATDAAERLAEMRADAEAKREAELKREREKEEQRRRNELKRAKGREQAAAKRVEQMKKSLDALRTQLEDVSLDGAKRAKLQAKADKIAGMLGETPGE